MAPPPEPMACTCSVGTLIGWWLMMVVLARTGSPSTIRPARNVVPPTSVEMMLRWPSCWPSDDRADDAAGQHRADRADRGGGCLGGGDGAAVALHDQQRAGEAQRRGASLSRLDR